MRAGYPLFNVTAKKYTPAINLRLSQKVKIASRQFATINYRSIRLLATS
jgi:hypothetical protein